MSLITSILPLFAQAAPAPQAIPWHQQSWFTAVLALIVVVVPFLLGQMLASRWRMTDYGWRIGLVLFSVIAGGAICWLGWPPRLGIDLSGGVILVYEVDPTKSGDYVGTAEDRVRDHLKGIEGLDATVSRVEGDKIAVSFPEDSQVAIDRVESEITKANDDNVGVTLVLQSRSKSDGKHVLQYAARADARLEKDKMDKLVGSIGKRVNPGGQKEVTVRSMGGDRVEVIIPRVDQSEIEVIKEKISTAGALKFRIVANPQASKHRPYIEVANLSDARVVKSDGKIIGEWLPVDVESAGKMEGHAVLRPSKKGGIEALVLEDDFKVGGQYLTRASAGFDSYGAPAVHFNFNTDGATRFGELTGQNKPEDQTGTRYGLAIILDDKVMSAPVINQRITAQGEINGDFTLEQVQTLVDILNAGSLPAALSKVPVAEYTSSAQLGQDTIKAAAYAMLISTGAILVFMLVYYRFAGLVADLAVVLNVLLVLALLILIKAHLTLAGVAGLVLSVGMSVDANVLIYERMREEMERGAALRMAIRNGFSRAMSTIIDSNLTTLIVGVVLYVIGTDQLRGFATTLILGLMLNLFTAVFCARLVFDVAERRRWITDLKMLKLFGRPNFDFMKAAKPAIIASLIFIAIGLAGAIKRGSGLFGIDFTGGSAVQLVFNDKTDIGDVRKKLSDSPDDFPDFTVSSVASGDRVESDTRFNINTSNTDQEQVKIKLQELFSGKLKMHSMTYTVAAASPAVNTPKVDAGGASEESDKPKAEENKADDKKSEGTKDDEKKTGMIRRGSATLSDAAGLLASAAPDSILLAQADKTDAKSADEKKADEKKADEAKSDETKAEQKKADEKKTDEKSSTPTTDTATTPAAADKPMAAAADKPASTTVEDNLTAAQLTFPDGISQEALDAILKSAAKELSLDGIFEITPTTDTDFTAGSSRAIDKWTVKSSLTAEQMETLLSHVKNDITQKPVFPSANSIGGKVAGDTKVMAFYALFVSNLLIIIYVWIRFQNLVFGLASVVALIHDVLIAFAALALSYWLAPFLGFLQVDQFKISLDVVAALLTIVGFSINDTIVIFDRIREVRGKSHDLTAGIVNRALNETLSRTILTSGTVFIVTLILYAAGGEGIHPFAFTMLIGVIAGSYSSLYIAAPLALWMYRKPARGSASGFSTGAGRVPEAV